MAAMRGFPIEQLDPQGAPEGEHLVVSGGRVTTTPASGSGSCLVPVTTYDGTDNAFVWADDQLVMVEVSL